VTELIIAQVVLGLLALLVVAFVALRYRGHAVPRAGRLTDAVTSAADRVAPGAAPPLGVLSSPEKSRAMSRRFERAEQLVRHGGRAPVSAGRD